MKNLIEYKGYLGSVEYSDEDETFFGKLVGIRALVSYEGESAKELKKAFQEAVDDYLKTCKSLDKEPEKPFKGSFNIRIDSELHRLAFILSEQKHINLNSFVADAIKEKIQKEQQLGLT